MREGIQKNSHIARAIQKSGQNQHVRFVDNREVLHNSSNNTQVVQLDKTSWRKVNTVALANLDESIDVDFGSRTEYLKCLNNRAFIPFTQNQHDAFDRICGKKGWDYADAKEQECSNVLPIAVAAYIGPHRNSTLLELKREWIKRLIKNKRDVEVGRIMALGGIAQASPRNMSQIIKTDYSNTRNPMANRLAVNWTLDIFKPLNYQYNNGYFYLGNLTKEHTTIYITSLVAKNWFDSESSLVRAATPRRSSDTFLGLHTSKDGVHSSQNPATGIAERGTPALQTRLTNAVNAITDKVKSVRETKTQIAKENPWSD